LTKVAVVLAVRNEEKLVGGALERLGDQTRRPDIVVVVDDGSVDSTPKLLAASHRSSSFNLRVVTLPRHDSSYVGKPELARTFNQGLKSLPTGVDAPDYIMILGADHQLPKDYLERMVARMESDPRLGVAAGRIVGEPHWDDVPRGSSMVARGECWRRASGGVFPLSFGWESWLYLKALSMGFATKTFSDIETRVGRPTSLGKGRAYGHGMYALGYYWLFALGRTALSATRSPAGALRMLAGFVDHRGVARLDVAEWVSRMQRRVLAKRVISLVSRAGRN